MPELRLGGNALDLAGHVYGRLTCTYPVGRNKHGQVIWRCECTCGTVIERIAAQLRKAKGKVEPSCGCAQREHARQVGQANAHDLTGQRFGKLTVIRRAGSTSGQSATWVCRCDCGRETNTARTAGLRSGNTTGCGTCIDYTTWWEDDITYCGLHIRIRATRGRARDLVCVRCGETADHWAYRGGASDERIDDQGLRYSPDPNDYDSMCVTCHRRMDVAAWRLRRQT